jgi:hypothetical protein
VRKRAGGSHALVASYATGNVHDCFNRDTGSTITTTTATKIPTHPNRAADAVHPDCADGKAEWLWGEDGTLEGNANAAAPEFNALPADSATMAALRQRKKARGLDADGAAAGSSAPAQAASAGAAGGASAGDSAAEKRVGFKWRPGEKRQTTGIWLWSTPYIRKLPGSDEPVAVLLMDTQGMFDSETSMNLTVSIFGLSALMASYQIYNVLARVQEDNLQHLATWAAYGRSVWQAAVEVDAEADARRAAGAAAAAAGGAPAGSAASSAAASASSSSSSLSAAGSKPARPAGSASGSAAGAASGSSRSHGTPYQALEFLVRDAVLRTKDIKDETALREEMSSHLAGVMSRTHLDDLRVTREQITESFESVSCYLLPHPGFEVSENEQYDGSIQQIRDGFRVLLERYVHKVFSERIAPKRLHGRAITASELQRLFVTYSRLFQDGKSFPEPKSLLTATAEANNRNAYDASLAAFRRLMDTMAGTGKPHVKDAELKEHAARCTEMALEQFDQVCAEDGVCVCVCVCGGGGGRLV